MFDVSSEGPFRVASLLWQPHAGAFALTVVCKATFLLLPGEARLAPEQDPPNEDDNYWDDDASRSLHAPCDLVPFKPRVDVLLTGNACAPGHAPVRALLARLGVGAIDKSIAVFGERSFAPDGQIREGSGFTRMPLRYERAAGGPGTVNPVGMRWDGAPDVALVPNLQPAGVSITRRSDAIAPVGFGAIAPWWPERQRKLGRHLREAPRDWVAAPLPPDLDPGFFNAAPADQQLDHLRDDERIMLENVHPELPRLSTALPGLRPRARALRSGATEDVPLRADTLWIDADRGVCAVLWRGQVHLADRSERGRVLVDVEPRPSPSLAEIEPRSLPSLVDEDEARLRSEGTVSLLYAGPSLRREALPFRQSVANVAAPPLAAPPAEVRPPPAYAPPIDLRAPPLAAPPPPAAIASVLEASNAAAARSEILAAPRAPLSAITPAPRTAAPRPRELVKLVWLDGAVGSRLRAVPAFRRTLLESDLTPAEDVEQAMNGEPEGDEARTRRQVSALLSRGDALDEQGVRLARAEAAHDDGLYEPPLVLVAGELSLPFDEVEVLKATIAAVSPFTVADRKLKESVAAVAELLQATWLEGAGSIAGELTRQVTEAFSQTKRPVAPEALAAQVERIVLTRRGYQKRPVLGEERLRGLLLPAGAREAIPTYLPIAVARELPMTPRLGVRLLGTVDTRQDPDERNPIALRVQALGVIVDAP